MFSRTLGFLLTGIALLGLGMMGCDTHSSPIVKAHRDMKDLAVTNVDPYPGQSDYNRNDPLIITFTAPVDPNSANANTIQISDPNGATPQGRFEVHGNQVFFWPQFPPGFSAMTNYTVTMPAYPISPTLRSMEDTPLILTYTFSFTTGSNITPDTTNPYVISVTPSDQSAGVPLDTNIAITFSEPIAQATVTSAFSLRDVASGSVVSGTLTLTNNQTVLEFDPEPSTASFPWYLSPNTLYEIQLTSSTRDISGNTLDGTPWLSFFTTGDTPTAASARGPFIENFTDNVNEDASQTDAEWNTQVSGSIVARVFSQFDRETDPGPSADPFAAIVGPFETSPYRSAYLLLNTHFTAPLTQLAGKRLTRLLWKHSGTLTGTTYSNLIVRIGHTTLTSFPASPPVAPNNTFSGLYLVTGLQVAPTVVSRLQTYTVPSTGVGSGGAYVEIPITGNFIFSGNTGDNIIIDIEVSGGGAQNLMSGDDQFLAAAPIICRATSAGGTYDTIQLTDNIAPYFELEFGGSLGSQSIDGAGAAITTLTSPVGSFNDIYVTTGGTIDTSQMGHGYGHLMVNTMYVAQGATLNIIGPNPCIIRATGTVRIEGRINANGSNGGSGAHVSTGSNTGGTGGQGGPGGGTGGSAGNGVPAGQVGNSGTDGTGFDNETTAQNGAGLLGPGGSAGAGGGGGGFAIAGSPGQNAGAAVGGLGGNIWGTTGLVFLSGGASGGGAGGGAAGLAGAGAGGGGGGGGGGYIQITTDRNMYIGPQASITAQGGNGGNAPALGQGGGGGAGSGGAILLQALALNFTGSGSVLNAQGGLGGQASAGGGAGGPQTNFPLNQVLADGRIRIESTVNNINNATITPAPQVAAGPALSGGYIPNPLTPTTETSDAHSTFIDTGCSSPQYTTAEIQYSDSNTPPTRVYVNFIGADPDILAQPTVALTYLYPQLTPEPLPLGGTLATVTLGPLTTGSLPGDINGMPPVVNPSIQCNSLNWLRFIRFHFILETNDYNTTPAVTRVTINYQY